MPTPVNPQRITKNTPLLSGLLLLIMAVSLYIARSFSIRMGPRITASTMPRVALCRCSLPSIGRW